MKQNKRRHKRFTTDLEINGKMILAQKVEIIDISLGGAALKTDRRLNINRDYLLKLEWKGKTLDVWSVVVRSELIGIETRGNGDSVSIYRAGVMFKDASSSTIADFIHTIEQDSKKSVSVTVDQRLSVRFQITTPCEETLIYPSQFKVKDISLSGMLIQTGQALGIESMIPMRLSLQNDNHVGFNGRVASCRTMEDEGHSHFDIGIEFKDLTDQSRTLLEAFIEYLTLIELGTAEKTNNEVTGKFNGVAGI